MHLDKYSIIETSTGEEALEKLKDISVDLILLDVMMPGIDGYETCKKIRNMEKHHNIPIIFLTAKIDEDSIEKAFMSGGSEYVSKPFKPKELLIRVKTQLELHDYKENMNELVKIGLDEITNLNKEITETQKEVIFTMGSIGESRSKETGNHVKRVAEYSYLFAKLLNMPEKEAEMLKLASPMHDIGKVGIPDAILNKPGKLDEHEWEVMKTHAKLGYRMLKHSNREILKTAAIVAYTHHEKWDGTGYPRGLKAEGIHIYGRITAISDVFDALGSDRCYKKAWDDEKIFNFLKEEKGKSFDPKLIDIFFEQLPKFKDIREKFKE